MFLFRDTGKNKKQGGNVLQRGIAKVMIIKQLITVIIIITRVLLAREMVMEYLHTILGSKINFTPILTNARLS